VGPLPENSVAGSGGVACAEGLLRHPPAVFVPTVTSKPLQVLLAQDGPRIIASASPPRPGAHLADRQNRLIDPGSPRVPVPEQPKKGRTGGPASDICTWLAWLIYAALGEGPFGSGDTARWLYNRVVHGKPNTDKRSPRATSAPYKRSFPFNPTPSPAYRDPVPHRPVGRVPPPPRGPWPTWLPRSILDSERGQERAPVPRQPAPARRFFAGRRF